MDFHTWSMRATGERITAGRATGLIGLNEEVEFEARHLGLTRRLRARITTFDAPRTFTDIQTVGPFQILRHTHTFEPLFAGVTRVTDRLELHVGWGWPGFLIERRFVVPHLRSLITAHQGRLRQTLETEDWRRFLAEPGLTPGHPERIES
jgi:ligand-binding SRPBCC domain-containing protein